MQGEVDGGKGRLEGGELGAGECAIGDYAVDEGLVDGAAEEGAITVMVVGSVGDKSSGVEEGPGGRRANLMMWYGAGL